MSTQMATPMGTEVGMSSMNAPNASVGVPVGAASENAAGGAVPAAAGGAGGGIMGILGGLSKLNSIAGMFGKDQKEREANAKTFAAMVKDVGATVQDMSESTLMQRMMEQNMRGPSFLNSGAQTSQGIAGIPRTFDPSLASHIMNQMGYK